MNLRRRLREIAEDLDDLAWEADDCDSIGINSEHATTILNLLRVLPHIVDHLEGFRPITDRDIRVVREETKALQKLANEYGIVEPAPLKSGVAA